MRNETRKEEGSLCGRNGCQGRLEIEMPQNCSCHIAPPCAACIACRLHCPACGWREEED